MRPIAAAGLASLVVAMNVQAEVIGFDKETPGTALPGWTAGATGKGTPRWTVEADPTAPSAPHVLKQSGSADFPWCVKKDAQIADGFVEVKFKPLSGREDQAGGVVWRWKSGDDYYVARANALENNVVILDGKVRISVKDSHIAGEGAVGVWTKADSVTVFDDFSYGPARR